MKIIIDAMGGDSPDEIVKGALASAKKYPDLGITVVGDDKLVRSVAEKENAAASAVEVISASDVITNNESPTMAIKTKKGSSMVKALNALKEDADAIAMISTGSTGAVLTAARSSSAVYPGSIAPRLYPCCPRSRAVWLA